MTLRLNRRRVLGAAAASAVAAAMPIRTRAKEMVSYAYLLDPSHDAVVYAMTHGKVASELIDVEVKALPIPALIQATSARQYDVIQTAVISLPRALDQGLKLSILSTALRYSQSGEGAAPHVSGVFRPDQEHRRPQGQDARRLRHRVHRHHSGALGTLEEIRPQCRAGRRRYPLCRASGLGAAGGACLRQDRRRDLDPQSGLCRRPDRAVPLDRPYRKRHVRNLRPAHGLCGQCGVFDRLLKASVDYALSHLDEVSAAVGKATGEEPDFFKAWFARYSDFPAVVSEQDIAAIGKLFELSKELGLLKDYPPPASLVWDHALRA
jgi:NitT/TauT family transport system substrate-binding protein